MEALVRSYWKVTIVRSSERKTLKLLQEPEIEVGWMMGLEPTTLRITI
jgi:hypothetical protein